ncbi:MAG: hypothetical protein ACTHOH_00885 [Lysobacteraceae bacterium]
MTQRNIHQPPRTLAIAAMRDRADAVRVRFFLAGAALVGLVLVVVLISTPPGAG